MVDQRAGCSCSGRAHSGAFAAPFVGRGPAFGVDPGVREFQPIVRRFDLVEVGPLGAGPGSNFDFARFSLQFPLNMSAASVAFIPAQKAIGATMDGGLLARTSVVYHLDTYYRH